MIIAIDLDSTLNTLDEAWLAMYNADYGDTMTPDDIKSWDTHLYVKPECGRAIYAYLNRPELFLQCGVKPGARAVVAELNELGHDIVVVSSCSRGSYDAKKEWLRQHFPYIPADNFIAAHRKSLVLGDVLIDDGFHNFRSWLGNGILFKAPWNIDKYNEWKNTHDPAYGIDYLADGWPGVKYALQHLGAYDAG